LMSTEEKVSALQENISRKGNNSYYYAHGAKIDGPAWDGKEEPRLLKSSVISSESTKKMVSAFESFSWLDGSKSVKIFIDFESASSVDDDKITLVFYTFYITLFINSFNIIFRKALKRALNSKL